MRKDILLVISTILNIILVFRLVRGFESFDHLSFFDGVCFTLLICVIFDFVKIKIE